MTTRTRACLLAATLLTGTALAGAQTLPRQGMSMDEVQRTFGAPAYDMGAVGRPAITRWVYDGFTVYFEGRRVLNSVQTQSLDSVAGDMPAAAATPPTAPAPVVAAPPAAQPAPAARPVAPTVAPAPVALPTPPAATAPAAKTPVPAFTPAPVAAPAAPAAPAVKPTPAPVATPAPVVADTPAYTPPAPKASSGNTFRFDPVTGRLILAEEEPAAAPADTPATEEETDDAPATAGEVGTADDQTLEFDPETGTFRAR